MLLGTLLLRDRLRGVTLILKTEAVSQLSRYLHPTKSSIYIFIFSRMFLFLSFFIKIENFANIPIAMINSIALKRCKFILVHRSHMLMLEEVTSYTNLVLLLRDIHLNAREAILVTTLLGQKESTANDLLLCSKQAILSCRQEK